MVYAERSVDSNVVPLGSAAEFSHSLDPKRILALCDYDEQKPDDRDSTAVVNPFQLADHEAFGGPVNEP